jgi:putative intracellular protease/amidase
MHIAVLLFDRFHAVDAVIPYERLSQVPGAHVIFVAERFGAVQSDAGRLVLQPEAELAELPHPDMVVVPGGTGHHDHLVNGTLHRWLRAAAANGARMLGIGDGISILEAAGVSVSTSLDDFLNLSSTSTSTSTQKGPHS